MRSPQLVLGHLIPVSCPRRRLQEQSIGIPPDLVDALKEVRGKRGELVVRTPDGERLAPPAFTEQVARDAARAGIGRPLDHLVDHLLDLDLS